jgi:carboxyl-terminal processing protease
LLPEHNHALKLTTALYFTPSGRSIQAKGINPDLNSTLTRQPTTATQRLWKQCGS